MSKAKAIWSFLRQAPLIVLVAPIVGYSRLAIASPANNTTSNSESNQTEQSLDPIATTDAVAQVTSVSQLSDVQPTDWAFQALQSLVERYGCIAGYPNGTYRGDRAMTRYEFAAGLNACLERINELIGTSTNNLVKKEDLATLQKLQEEFSAELATLRGRVDALESRTSELEAHQFSTTTKLNGEAIFAVAGIASGDNASGEKINRNTILGDRIRLNFDTSFTGKDLLRTRLQATNLNAFSGNSTFTPQGDFRFAGGTFANDNNNDVGIDALLYQYPLAKNTNVFVEANAGAADDFTNTVNPYLDGDGGSGAISHFGTRNPIYYLVNGTGLGIQHQFSKNLELSLGYLANDAANPQNKSGLFNGPYGAIAQLTVKPTEKFTLGLTYVNSYNNDFTANGSTGSNRANLRSALLNNPNLPDALAPFSGADLPTSSNAYGAEASLQLSDKFILGGWAGYTNTRILSSNGSGVNRGTLDIWNWAVTLAFPDLGKKGNLAGIVVGMEPYVTSSSVAQIGKDKNNSYHVEAFYQYKVSDNISVTPGIIWLTSPDNNSNHNDDVIGALRTTFTF
ncbi:iron uptake porin [Nostoc sp. CENA67]|uniref:Iron uptake porin n=1 Tax=Amazonocrinis nigriterrae CENA67 TaxID=2794033 RepID=A0A8J7LBK4_9NOST|nr:iron uptake porin [Amazonocrinis nigriterrae]MBH8566828.1 iron uptake porin [Amazonocrinis nigriterrae CENA67]